MATSIEQPRTPEGTFAALPAAAVDQLKARVIEQVALGIGLKAAVEAAGAGWATVWRWQRTDPEFAQALEDWRRGVGLKAVVTMAEALDHPEDYEDGLKYGNWGNFAMINAKATFPDMRDSAQITVNVGTKIELGDWQAAVRAARETAGEIEEA